jgi:RNA polymerase sigma factor (sigma-70 family)
MQTHDPDLHPCLKSEGKSPDCQSCSVSEAGYLEEFLKNLSRTTYKINEEKELDELDRKEIVSDFVIRVHENIHRFRGQSQDGKRSAKFSTWAYRVLESAKNDYYRREKRINRNKTGFKEFLEMQHETVRRDHSEKRIIEKEKMNTVMYLRNHKKHGKCARLLIDHYDWAQQGLSQAQMAELSGTSHAAFRKEISRCRKSLKKVLEEANDQRT